MKFEKSRFHIEFGPESLFERVIFKMKDIHELKFTTHCIKRCIERQIPIHIIDEIKEFNIQNWQLVTSEVRNDKGKFINYYDKVAGDKMDSCFQNPVQKNNEYYAEYNIIYWV